MSVNRFKDELIREIKDLNEKSIIRDDLFVRLKDVIQESSKHEKELKALMYGSKAVLNLKTFTESARAIFDHCKDLIGAASGYVALLSDSGQENELLFLEAGGLPCNVDPELPMPIRGLRAEAYKYNKAVYHNDFMNSEWVDFMPEGHVILKNVLFSPLILEGRTVGIMGLANKAGDFTDHDARVATGFGELAAIALQNSKYLDERIRAEKQREKVIKDLENALSEIKTLQGLIPICMVCKNIRNDQGAWDQLEKYITEHSDARFTHGICPDCLKEHMDEKKRIRND
jgi:GAF domain-containing protein